MEEQTNETEVTLAVAETKTAVKPPVSQLFLPISILLAALIIAGTLIYTRNQGGNANNGSAQIAGNNAQVQPGGTPVNIPTSTPVNIQIGPNDHVLGNSNAKITIVEFGDFRCPFCERLFQQVEPQIKQDYVNTGKANFVFRHYAFLGQQSVWASEAAECAAEQGKFWEYHNWLYGNQAPETDLAYYSKANLTKYAGKVGINTSQFASCLNTDKYAKRVADNLAEGQKDGVTGTPTVFINGQKIVGAQPYANFQSVIDSLLK